MSAADRESYTQFARITAKVFSQVVKKGMGLMGVCELATNPFRGVLTTPLFGEGAAQQSCAHLGGLRAHMGERVLGGSSSGLQRQV